MGFTPITETAYEAGRKRGQDRLANAVRALAVHYDPGRDFVTIQLSETASLTIARSALTEWADLPSRDLQSVRLSAARDAVMVEGYDVQIGLSGLLRDVLGAAGDRGLARDAG